MINIDKNNMETNEIIYTIDEVAKMLRVSYLTVYRWIQAGKLPAIKAGKQYRITKSQLDKFLEIQK